jgi:hypothetical protein
MSVMGKYSGPFLIRQQNSEINTALNNSEGENGTLRMVMMLDWMI